MNVLDLFSGIGGFSLGLERAGMTTVAFCEMDVACQKVLKKHWPTVPIFNDVKELSSADLQETIDVICGGFPCQDISLVGKGGGTFRKTIRLMVRVFQAYQRNKTVLGHYRKRYSPSFSRIGRNALVLY
jgi:site-specific DNA-cytosine methylase